MPEFAKADPFASFAATCCLCIGPRPVHKEGMCATHYAQYGSKAWNAGATAPEKKVRAFRLTPLHKSESRLATDNDTETE